MSQARIGRTILQLYQHGDITQDRVIRSSIGTILATGQAMDFAARLRGYGSELTPDLAIEFARFTGINMANLRLLVLPSLKAAGVLDYQLRDTTITSIEEYVGVTAPFLDQVVAVLNALGPSDAERCVLQSVELGTWAPLTQREHLDYLIRHGGHNEQSAHEAITLALSIGINQRVRAERLGDEVIYSPYVWGSKAVDIAAFLKSLPPVERDVILGICEAATMRPGIALSDVHMADASVIRGVRKVGLLQAATVVSTSSGLSKLDFGHLEAGRRDNQRDHS